MKKIKCLVVILLLVMTCLIMFGCSINDNEPTIINEYKGSGKTDDEIPLYYVKVSVIVTDSINDVEFAASDFSIVINGVKENGNTFITGFEFSGFNEDRTYVSFTEPTVVIKNNAGKNLQIVFSGIDNITELYYKNVKISLK